MHFDEALVVAIAFFVFVALATKPLLKAITGGLDSRSEKIRKELDEAVRLKEEAQALLASFQRKQKKALQEAEDIIANAQEEAQRVVSSTKKKVEEEIAKRSELAMQKIEQAESNAIQSIHDNAVDITISAARQLIVENLNQEASETLISKAVTDLGRKFH